MALVLTIDRDPEVTTELLEEALVEASAATPGIQTTPLEKMERDPEETRLPICKPKRFITYDRFITYEKHCHQNEIPSTL